MADNNKLTLIHMQNSASQSILWLLEELQIPYTLIPHPRPDGPAPPALKQTHVQGKAPQLITPSGKVITQLSAITLYLLREHDPYNKFHDRTGPDVLDGDLVREEQLVCIGVADAASKIGMKMLFGALADRSPWFIRPVLTRVRNTIDALVLDADIRVIMSVLEAELGGAPVVGVEPAVGRKWFMGGDGPSRPDFVLRFFVDLAVHPGYVRLGDWPCVEAWVKRCDGREGWKRALEKGNGYHLDFLVKR